VTVWKCVKTSLWTLMTKELAVASWQCTASHLFFNQEIFYQKQNGCHPPPPPLLAWLGQLRQTTKLRWLRQNRMQCWTTSQNMTSRMHLKIGGSAGKGVYAWKGTTLRLMVVSRPKFSVWLDGSTCPRSYGYHLLVYAAHLCCTIIWNRYQLASYVGTPTHANNSTQMST
jgi:hypothetical protein